MAGFDLAEVSYIKKLTEDELWFKVSNLYISQVKNANKNSVCIRKCGIEVGENYNLPKSENIKQPQCPIKKKEQLRRNWSILG